MNLPSLRRKSLYKPGSRQVLDERIYKSPSIPGAGWSPPPCQQPAPFSSLMRSRGGSRSVVPWESLTGEILAASRVYPGNNYRLQKVIQKLQAGDGARIAVAGGSVTLGYICDGSSSPEMQTHGRLKAWSCAWPQRLQEWLWLAYPSTPRDRLQVVNIAKQATTMQWAATFLSSYAKSLGHDVREFDLFIVDYEINDQHAGRDMTQVLVAATEELLVQLLTLPQAPAVLFFFAGTAEMNAVKGAAGRDDPKFIDARPWIQEEQMPLIRHYQVPALSWRDAFWPVAYSPSRQRHPLLDCHDNIHPTHCLHYVWAALVADLLRHQAEIYCRHTGRQSSSYEPATGTRMAPHANERGLFRKSTSYTVPENRLLAGGFKKARHEAHYRMLTMLSVDVGREKFLPSEVNPPGGWQFREDMPGKPGWIVEGPGGGEEICFDVLFSRRIVLGYLRSYENMAQVQVFMDKLIAPPGGSSKPGSSPPKYSVVMSEWTPKRAASAAKVLDATWHGKSSQYYQATVVNNAAVQKPPMWVRVRLRRVPTKGKGKPRGLNKFKLLAVLSY
eukprot:jgi/Mesvir1/24642/Mv21950-RA.3